MCAHRDPPDPGEGQEDCVICGDLTDNFINGQPICWDCYEAQEEAKAAGELPAAPLEDRVPEEDDEETV